MLTFFNITEYPYGVTRQPPNGSLTAVPSNNFEEIFINILLLKTNTTITQQVAIQRQSLMQK